MNWWEESVFYQVYISKFNDSNGDGIGDIQGIIDKLDYIETLGVDALWITPFYPHSHADGGYDVKEYTEISTEFGNLKKFQELVQRAHQVKIKIIIDLVINHSSIEHQWFKQSVKRIEPYDNYYIWQDQPNNWESFFKGSAWVYSDQRNQYYYSSFSDQQADLNWSDPQLIKEFQEIIHFWLEMGVDGFRFDVINNLTIDSDFQDNPLFNSEQLHIHDRSNRGLKDVLRNVFKIIPDHIVKIGEISSNKAYEINAYLEKDLFDLCFNFNFLDLPHFDAESLYNEIKITEETLPNHKMPTLVFSSHDAQRIMDRLANFHVEKAKAIAFFLLTARGVPFIFQGDELLMKGKPITSMEDIEDIQGVRAFQESYRQNQNSEKSFKEAKKYSRDNSRNFVAFDQVSQKIEFFEFYQQLIDFRKKYAYYSLPYVTVSHGDDILEYQRGKFTFILNLSKTKKNYPFGKNQKIIFSTLTNQEKMNTHFLEAFEAIILEKDR